MHCRPIGIKGITRAEQSILDALFLPFLIHRIKSLMEKGVVSERIPKRDMSGFLVLIPNYEVISATDAVQILEF